MVSVCPRLVVIVHRSSYTTPTVPPVIFCVTIAPLEVALPDTMLLGEASVPLYTVQATDFVEMVSPLARSDVKSNLTNGVEPVYFGGNS